MSGTEVDVTGCDLEPIHIPGLIQPFGLMLVLDTATMMVRHVAGDVEGRLGVTDWLGQPLQAVIGAPLADSAIAMASACNSGFVGGLSAPDGDYDVSLQFSGPYSLIELEPSPRIDVPASKALSALELAGHNFSRAATLRDLCEEAAIAFRDLTGFDRVMVYRFLDDDAGSVLAEAKRPDLGSFLNHHFPGSDIPRQARELYVRNLIRVIPDATYAPVVLRPAWTGDVPLDLSDASLRSVSPIHLQYLRNMGVTASASVSIVKDGVLWGLIACHNMTPRRISYDVRVACRTLASSLSARIKAREDAESYRDRLRLRGFEEDIVALLSRDGGLEEALSNHARELLRMMMADGVAVLHGGDLVMDGVHPSEDAVRKLANWVERRSDEPVFSTDRLSSLFVEAEAYQAVASGLLSLVLSGDETWMILWFRAEEVEIVEWAGNPHKDRSLNPGETLSPRASFEAWREAVHGRSRRWTLEEVAAATRLRPAVLTVRQTRRIRDLNLRLNETIADKDLLLEQKEFLIGEVNHRVQNSLQLVSGFLGMQATETEDAEFQAMVDEARRRIQAVALVHRRLYRGDQLELVDAARYLGELCEESVSSMGPKWADMLVLDLAPIRMRTNRAVTVGLLLTELMINANKYAYGGAPGPLEIRLIEDRNRMRLVVADRGKGRTGTRKGFGSRMMDAMVRQLGGELNYEDAAPGLRATLVAPVE